MSAGQSHYVECPDCHCLMEVETEHGKVIHRWAATDRNRPAVERFQDALQKIEDDKKKRADFLSSAAGELEKKRRKAQELFGEELKKIKRDGLGEPPPNPFDLD